MFIKKTRAYNAGWKFFEAYCPVALQPRGQAGKNAREEAMAFGVAFAKWQGLRTRHMPRTHGKAKEARRAHFEEVGERVIPTHTTPRAWLKRQAFFDAMKAFGDDYAVYVQDMALYNRRKGRYHAAMKEYIVKLRAFGQADKPIRPVKPHEPRLEEYWPVV